MRSENGLLVGASEGRRRHSGVFAARQQIVGPVQHEYENFRPRHRKGPDDIIMLD